MFKHTPPDTLERVARAMCIADHNDPDRKVARYIQEHLNGMAQHKQYLPVEQHCVPAWHLYTHLVPAAIEALEAVEIASVMNDAMQYWSAKEAVSHTHQVNDPGHSTGILNIPSRIHHEDEPGVLSDDCEMRHVKIPMSYDPVREMEQLAADILNEPFENEAKRNVDFLALNKELSS